MTPNSENPRKEVAVFVDLENLRYSPLNLHSEEPDFAALVEKAKKYGRPTVMRAYADFSEHPPGTSRQLQVVGIEAINVPVKRLQYSRGARQVERVKNAADMNLALDALVEASDADSNGKSKIFLLVTGDADYIKLVTQLRNRFGQEVVIAGVPGAVGNDLIAASGKEDPIEIPEREPVDKHELKKAIVSLVKKGPSPLDYWSIAIIRQWCVRRSDIPGRPKEKGDAIHELVSDGVLLRQEIDLAKFGKQGKAQQTILIEEKARELNLLEQ